MNKINSFKKNIQHGQSLVELAISMTVILLLLSGLVTFGMAFFTYVSLSDAAQEGALYGSVNGDATGTLTSTEITAICNAVKQTSNTPVNFSSTDPATKFSCTQGQNTGNNINVQVTGASCENGASGSSANAIVVTVSYNFPVSMPFISGIIGSNTIHLLATATDTFLQPPCN
jgi:Flp pilus assembly protein TadG